MVSPIAGQVNCGILHGVTGTANFLLAAASERTWSVCPADMTGATEQGAGLASDRARSSIVGAGNPTRFDGVAGSNSKAVKIPAASSEAILRRRAFMPGRVTSVPSTDSPRRICLPFSSQEFHRKWCPFDVRMLVV